MVSWQHRYNKFNIVSGSRTRGSNPLMQQKHDCKQRNPVKELKSLMYRTSQSKMWKFQVYGSIRNLVISFCSLHTEADRHPQREEDAILTIVLQSTRAKLLPTLHCFCKDFQYLSSQMLTPLDTPNPIYHIFISNSFNSSLASPRLLLYKPQINYIS